MTKRYPDLTSFPCHTTVIVLEFACLAQQMLEQLLSSKVNRGCQKPYITATEKRAKALAGIGFALSTEFF